MRRPGRRAALLATRIVYFDFDSSEIKGAGTDVVAAHAKYLASHSSTRVRLEGHTDERGSREYNIGLGERRAQAVRRALLLQGATEAQITTVSYGEERPAVPGHDESAWAKNRRVEIVYLAAPVRRCEAVEAELPMRALPLGLTVLALAGRLRHHVAGRRPGADEAQRPRCPRRARRAQSSPIRACGAGAAPDALQATLRRAARQHRGAREQQRGAAPSSSATCTRISTSAWAAARPPVLPAPRRRVLRPAPPPEARQRRPQGLQRHPPPSRPPTPRPSMP